MVTQQEIQNTPERQTLSKILKVVCRELKVTPQQIQSESREVPLPMAREIFSEMSYKLTEASWDEISRWINKAHSTARSAARRCRTYCKNESDYNRKYTNCIEAFYWDRGFADLFYLNDEKDVDRWMFLQSKKKRRY